MPRAKSGGGQARELGAAEPAPRVTAEGPYQYDEYLMDIGFSLFRSDSPFYLTRMALWRLHNAAHSAGPIDGPPLRQVTYGFEDRPRYLEYYLLHLANDLSLVKGPANPFVQAMLPLALDSAALLHALAALAAAHLRGAVARNVDGDVHFHCTRAASLVGADSDADRGADSDADRGAEATLPPAPSLDALAVAATPEPALATLLVLSLVPAHGSRASAAADRAATYLAMARRIVAGLAGLHGLLDGASALLPSTLTSACPPFLLELFAFQDLRLAPSRLHASPLPVARALRSRIEAPVLGFAPQLFGILGQLLCLGETTGWELGTASGPCAEACRLLQALYSWTLPVPLVGSPDGALAEALRLASVLAVQEHLPGYDGSDDTNDVGAAAKEDLVGRLVARIASIAPSGPLATGLVWPWILLVAGCNVHALSRSAGLVLARFDAQKDGLPGRDAMRQALETRWRSGSCSSSNEPNLLRMLGAP